MLLLKHKAILLIVFAGFIWFSTGLLTDSVSSSYTLNKDNILRLHILGNSDSQHDQQLKLAVRDTIIDYLEPRLRNINDREAVKAIINAEHDKLQELAEQRLQAEACSAPVRIELTELMFPLKAYGELVLPAGSYQSLQILIGNAAGANWWCVLYPPLCFFDEGQLKNAINDDASTIRIEVNENRTVLLKSRLWEMLKKLS